MTIPTAIEIFAGCGGLSTGLLDAGVDVRLGTDYYGPAMRTYEFNHAYRGSKSLVADVRGLSGKELLASAGIQKGKLRLLAGGPPCQPFSIIGKREGLEDPRGDLVFEFVRLLREAAPAAFIFENVAHLATVHDGAVLEALLRQMRRAGYGVSYSVLNAADYGVPQMRKRLIIIGVMDCDEPPFPPPATHFPESSGRSPKYRTAADVLSDLPDVSSADAILVPNHEGTHHSPSMVEAFERLEPGKRDKKSHHDRLHPDRPSYTLRAGTGNFSPLRPVHYSFNRVISVRESARIQSFSDDFIWPSSIPRLQQYRQVGNAVPPLLAKVLGSWLGSYLGWDLDPIATRGSLKHRERWVPESNLSREKERRSRIRGASLGRGR